MMYHCSFNRFILISLALLGLSVSSANASLVSGNTTFGDDTTTIDTVSGLEWLDLTHTAGLSYDVVSARLVDSGDDLFGWRYATLDEVATFWTNAGGGGGSYAGDADAWVEGIFGYWATSVAGGEDAYFLTAEGGAPGSHVYGLLADYSNQSPTPPSEFLAYLNSGEIEDSNSRFDIGSALVKVTVVPVPAAIWLFGTALIGFVGISRRRKLA